MIQKILLSCGIFAPLLYLGMDLLAGKLIKSYNFSVHSMSDLGAAGSPTRKLVIVLTLVAGPLLMAFGVGVWRTAGVALLPKIVAAMIIGNAFFGLIATLFFPNNFGVRPAFATPEVLLMFLSVLCFVLAMVIGAAAFHGWMRVISIIIPAAYVLLGILRFTTASDSVVMIGSQERTMSYSFLAWLIALSIYLFLLTGRGADSISNYSG